MAKAQMEEVPGGEGLASSSQWEQSHFPWSQGHSRRERTLRKEQGLGLHKARDLGSLLTGPQSCREKSMSTRVCVCVGV